MGLLVMLLLLHRRVDGRRRHHRLRSRMRGHHLGDDRLHHRGGQRRRGRHPHRGRLEPLRRRLRRERDDVPRSVGRQELGLLLLRVAWVVVACQVVVHSGRARGQLDQALLGPTPVGHHDAIGTRHLLVNVLVYNCRRLAACGKKMI